MFLFHQGVNGLVHAMLFGTVPRMNVWESLLATADAFIITVFLAALSWRFIEQPFIALGKRRVPCFHGPSNLRNF